MFDSLTGKLGEIFDGLTRRGALAPEDVELAMREVRVALLEADVSLPLVKDFIAKVEKKALGAEILRSVTPGQMVVKIVHDELVELLGGGSEEGVLPSVNTSGINLAGTAPVA
ncbi:MAG: signal recognition particle protein, partial [Rhodospirillaceae bacterium]|nr:signal recognition particle protein [Rhodospirillaceae bacterium]